MIDWKIKWFIYKEMVRYYSINKLKSKDKDISEILYEDILRTFYTDEYGVYTLYLMNAPDGEIGLDMLLHEEGLIKWSLPEQELQPYFDFLVVHLTNKFYFTDCKVVDHALGSNRYLKVYRNK